MYRPGDRIRLMHKLSGCPEEGEFLSYISHNEAIVRVSDISIVVNIEYILGRLAFKTGQINILEKQNCFKCGEPRVLEFLDVENSTGVLYCSKCDRSRVLELLRIEENIIQV